MEEQPSLLGEIGKFAWLLAKVLAAVSAVLALLAWLILRHPVVGIVAFYGLLLAALILFAGWQNYKSELQNWKWRQWRRNQPLLRSGEAHLEERGPGAKTG